jgi:hypothetical protein
MKQFTSVILLEGFKNTLLSGFLQFHLGAKSIFTLIGYFAMLTLLFGVLLPPMLLKDSWFLFLVGVCNFFCCSGDLLAGFVFLNNSNVMEQVNHLHRTVTCISRNSI